MVLLSDLGPVFVSVLLWSCLFLSAAVLKTIKKDTAELTCSQGLTNCNVSSDYQFSNNLAEPYGSVDVTQVQLTAALCLSASINEYELCLQVIISLQEDVPPEGSAEDDDEEEALIKVGLFVPGSTGIWKALTFNRSYTGSGQHSKHSHYEVVLLVKGSILEFGTPLVVHTILKSYRIQNITIPDYKEVCKSESGGTITKCVVPYLRAVIEHENKVWLKIENVKHQKGSCLVDWDGISGEHYTWAEGESEINISQVFVAPCLCFQAWWDGEDKRGRYCPFKHHKDAFEKMQHNVSVTLAEPGMRKNGNVLTWNVTSVCMLQGEVRLCKKDGTGAQCEEVMGSTQKLGNSWTKSSSRHWQAGEFSVSKHHLLCVQFKINGMESFSEPQCPFTVFPASRVRWILPLLIGLMLICLAILGAYLVQGVLKGYVWKWLKEDDVKGAVGGGHVVLLYPSDDDRHLPGMLCHLGSSLQALGFTVSLDLWSQTELSALGPVPWLHSRLDQLQRQGGKVVLVLTKATWTRAEEWGALSNDGVVNRDAGEVLGRSYPPSSRRVDVFGASLSCILADYLQGRAGERFMLVQFESLPPEPPDGFRPLPCLFCGLHVYSLPSQSLGFLTELAGTKHIASASARRKRAGGLRKASRALAQKLSGFTAGTNVFRLAGVSQGCVGGEVEDSGETVPLQPDLTPLSSPETESRAGLMEPV
nr:uncharacterized protein LOC107391127 [Nothobranchius furzeri]